MAVGTSNAPAGFWLAKAVVDEILIFQNYSTLGSYLYILRPGLHRENPNERQVEPLLLPHEVKHVQP
jgi:hypothetical protein